MRSFCDLMNLFYLFYEKTTPVFRTDDVRTIGQINVSMCCFFDNFFYYNFLCICRLPHCITNMNGPDMYHYCGRPLVSDMYHYCGRSLVSDMYHYCGRPLVSDMYHYTAADPW